MQHSSSLAAHCTSNGRRPFQQRISHRGCTWNGLASKQDLLRPPPPDHGTEMLLSNMSKTLRH